MSFSEDKSHYAVYQVGPDLVAVKLAGWLDGVAVLLPREGAKLDTAASVPGFVGLWKRPPPRKHLRQPTLGKAVRCGLPALEEDRKADITASIRARFPDMKRGGRLRFETFPPINEGEKQS